MAAWVASGVGVDVAAAGSGSPPPPSAIAAITPTTTTPPTIRGGHDPARAPAAGRLLARRLRRRRRGRRLGRHHRVGDARGQRLDGRLRGRGGGCGGLRGSRSRRRGAGGGAGVLASTGGVTGTGAGTGGGRRRAPAWAVPSSAAATAAARRRSRTAPRAARRPPRGATRPSGGRSATPGVSGVGSNTSLGGAGAGTPKVTKPVTPEGSSSSGSGAGMACEGIGVGGPTIGSGIDGVASDGGGVHIGGAAGEPPVSDRGAPQANDLNSSEASPPLTLVPWNGAGVSGLAPPAVGVLAALDQARLAAPARAEQAEQDLLEVVPRVLRVLGAALGLLDQQALDPVRDALVDLGPDRLHRRDRLVDVAQQDRHRRVGVVERDVAREQLERHAADRVEVSPRTDVLRHGLLGRHVSWRADSRPGRGQERAGLHPRGRLGDAEVRDLHAPVGRDHEVLGLQVAVHDLVRLGVSEAGEQAFEDSADLRHRHPRRHTGAVSRARCTPSRCTACRRARSSREPSQRSDATANRPRATRAGSAGRTRDPRRGRRPAP